MEKDFSFLDDLQVIAEEDILDSALDRDRIWLIQNSEGAIFGPYMEDELRRVAYEQGKALNFCNACRLSDRQWKLFFDHPQFQRRAEVNFPPLPPRNQENFEEFFVLHQGQKHGPYTPEAIQQMLIKKILNMQGLISADKGKTWKKVYHFELFDRRRDGKFAVPAPVKSQTLQQITKGSAKDTAAHMPLKGQSLSPSSNQLSEELTSTILLGQKHMPLKSPKQIQSQFQKEFSGIEFTGSHFLRLSFWQQVLEVAKKHSKGLSLGAGLFLIVVLGKLLFPTHPNPTIKSGQSTTSATLPPHETTKSMGDNQRGPSSSFAPVNAKENSNQLDDRQEKEETSVFTPPSEPNERNYEDPDPDYENAESEVKNFNFTHDDTNNEPKGPGGVTSEQEKEGPSLVDRDTASEDFEESTSEEEEGEKPPKKSKKKKENPDAAAEEENP